MNSDEMERSLFERVNHRKAADADKPGTSASLQHWITFANQNESSAAGAAAAVVGSESSSSSVFKLANFNFFSTEKLAGENESDENFFLEHCSPSIYLIENSETVNDYNMASTSNSFLLEDHSDENDNDDYSGDENEDDAAIMDTVSHFRKIFEKNVVRVKRPRHFVSLPDLRAVRWLSAHDYFYYSLQDLTNLAEFYPPEDDDDMLNERTTATTTPTTTATHLMYAYNSNCSLKDDQVLVGDQQTTNMRQSSSSSEDDDEDDPPPPPPTKTADRRRDDDDGDDDEYVIHDSGSEEITWSKDGDNEIRTLIKLKRNAQNRSWEKTTVVTTFFPDGLSHTDTYYETLFDDDEDDASSDDGDDDMTAIDEETVRRRYEKCYQLRGNQYDLLKKCFRKMESDGFISRPLLRAHIQVQVKDRSRLIRADEDTIDRTLSTIDTDDDENISFQDFLDYLYLFFSSKKNIRTKIVNVLSGHKRKHLARGSLTEREAVAYFDFLARFYGLKDDEKKKATFDDLQSYAEFADKVASTIEDKLFVTWL